MEHSWAILATHALNQRADNLVESLIASQHPDGSFGVNLMVSALATLAVDTALSGRNPLKYGTDSTAAPTRNLSPEESRKESG